MLRISVAAALIALAGCSAHKAEVARDHHSHGGAALASADGAGCHARKAATASMEGEGCPAKEVETAAAEGAACHARKAATASMEGAGCHARKGETASAEGAACADCPRKADGSCDHEAGAKAGRACCKAELAEAGAPTAIP